MRIATAILTLIFGLGAARADTVSWRQVRPVFAKHCLSCHDAKNAEGKLVIESYDLLMKGGEDGPAVVPGKADQSALVLQIERKSKPFMPPKKAKDRLSAEEIALIRGWVES